MTKRRTPEQTTRNVNTGGGQYVEGDVNMGGGDFVGGDRVTRFEHVDGSVAVDGGEAVDARHSQGMVYKPSGDVHQHFGDNITIIQSPVQEPTIGVQVDLQACEQRYRECVKARYAEDAGGDGVARSG